MTTLMRNGRDRRSGKPVNISATRGKNACFWLGFDQRITSGPAAIAAALKGRIHGCTRTLRRTSDSSCIAGAVHTWHTASFRCDAKVRTLLEEVKRTWRERFEAYRSDTRLGV